MMASVAAAQSAGGSPSATVQQTPQLIQASLATGPATPGAARARDAAGTPQAHAAASPTAQQAEEDASGGTALPMLLAALALMTGIAVRRWGGGTP